MTRLFPTFGYHFGKLQRDARALLAAERAVKVEAIDWPHGRFHDLRATYATETAPIVDLLTLCRWLGHSTPRTTQRYYHQTKRSTADRARVAMDARYGDSGAKAHAQRARERKTGTCAPVCADENGVLATIGA